MNNANLIASDISNKQKSVEAQRRYRLRLKNGGAEWGTEYRIEDTLAVFLAVFAKMSAN